MKSNSFIRMAVALMLCLGIAAGAGAQRKVKETRNAVRALTGKVSVDIATNGHTPQGVSSAASRPTSVAPLRSTDKLTPFPGLSETPQGKKMKKQMEELVALKKKNILGMTGRFVNYAKISSQSVDSPDMNEFPLTEGQRQMAAYLENELRAICKGKDIQITRSESEYIYVKIPSNMKKEVPSLMFMAHLDITPEAPAGNITPIVHAPYDGKDIKLPAGITLSPDSPQGQHLKNCIGKTVITSDGTTLLGADDKAGTTILVTLIEKLMALDKLQHGDLYFVFSQNEDIGRAADRFESRYVDGSPDIVIDVDGDRPDRFSVENFSAAMRIYRFRGHDAHPGEGFANRYGDALTAAAHFIGMIPPEKHPSASKDKQGYIHCYSLVHPDDSLGRRIEEDYLVKVRLRYFDRNEGDTLRQMLDRAETATAEAFPFVKVEAEPETLQYENVAYSMYPGTAGLIMKSAEMQGLEMKPKSERGGTTSAMMAAKGLRGGPCIFSGQQAEHSVLEWVCVEDMWEMTCLAARIISNVAETGK